MHRERRSYRVAAAVRRESLEEQIRQPRARTRSSCDCGVPRFGTLRALEEHIREYLVREGIPIAIARGCVRNRNAPLRGAPRATPGTLKALMELIHRCCTQTRSFA